MFPAEDGNSGYIDGITHQQAHPVEGKDAPGPACVIRVVVGIVLSAEIGMMFQMKHPVGGVILPDRPGADGTEAGVGDLVSGERAMHRLVGEKADPVKRCSRDNP